MGTTKAKTRRPRRASDARGTGSRGTENRLAPPISVARRSSAVPWSVMGDDAIPDVLAHGLLKEKELEDAMLYEPALVPEKCADLYAAWEFLFDAQHRSKHDPKDGALLITSSLRAFGRARIKTELRPSGIGDESIPVATQWEDAELDVWQPSSFPRQTPEEIAAYPTRPKRVAQIPPFSAENVRAWREVLQGEQRMLVQTAPGKSDPPPNRPPAPDPRAAAEMLERAAEQARRTLIDVTVANVTGGDTPLVNQALVNLSLLTLEDITRQTKVKLPTDKGNLLESVEAFFFHSSRTVVLDKHGEPTNLGGRLTYPILVAEPGHPMRRDVPSSGLYISVQRYGFSTFRVDGSRVSKVLFGGVGGMLENHGGGIFAPHPLHVTIEEYLKSLGRFVYVASITTEAARNPRPLTLASIEERTPILARATMPFLVKKILARIPTTSEEIIELVKQVAIEVIKEIIIEEIRERVIAFVVKKLGSKLIPLVNVAVALMDLFDDEQNARIRHALATAEMGVRAQTTEEVIIAAKVMSEIMADEFGDRVVEILVSKLHGMAKKKLAGHGHDAGDTPTDADTSHADAANGPPAADPSAHVAPSDAPGAAGQPSAVDAPGAAGAPPAQHAPPAANAPSAVDAPSTPSAPAKIDAPASPDTPPSHGAPGATKQPVGLMGTAPPDDDHGPRRRPSDEDTDASRAPRDERAVDDPATDDTGRDDPGTGFRVGEDRIGVGEPPPIMRIGEDAIGVSDRDPSPIPTRRTSTTYPGRPVYPDRSSPMGIANRTIGDAVRTNIGGADVESRHPHVLVGARRDQHREDVLAMLEADPNHPMRPMFDEASAGSPDGPAFVSAPYRYGNMSQWQQNPQDWQSGHARSGRAGDADVLVVQSRYENQRTSADLERRGDMAMDGAFVIGGIAVDRQSARDLRDAGYIRMTPEELEAQPVIYFDRNDDDERN